MFVPSIPISTLSLLVVAAVVIQAELAPLPKSLTQSPEREAYAADDILKGQELLKSPDTEADGLEHLGWTYIGKSRVEHDDVSYWHALACADVLEERHPQRKADALLLRGHVWHQQHQFAKALQIGERLVSERGNTYDQALLGDVLLDLGRVHEAGDAYQRMLDLRPGLAAYLRGAELRWLTGDVDGTLDLMLRAVKAGDGAQAEPLAWAYTRLSYFLWAAGQTLEAEAAAHRALILLPDYLPATVARARVDLTKGEPQLAINRLTPVINAQSEPLTLWLLWECYTLSGDEQRASEVQKQLLTAGVQKDPRTVSLFLSTIGNNAHVALSLAEDELRKRQDCFTQDALAWAHLSLARKSEQDSATSLARAENAMAVALATGVQDARLFLHAGILASEMGKSEKAKEFFERSQARRHMLYPSESRLLAIALGETPMIGTIKAPVVTRK